MGEPWDRLDTESDKAWLGFRLYRDLGPGRSIEGVRKQFGETTGKPAPKTGRHLENWSSKHRWVDRAAAYDAHLDGIAQAARKQQVSDRARKWGDRRDERLEKGYVESLTMIKAGQTLASFPPVTITTTKDDNGVITTITYQAANDITILRCIHAMRIGQERCEAIEDRALNVARQEREEDELAVISSPTSSMPEGPSASERAKEKYGDWWEEKRRQVADWIGRSTVPPTKEPPSNEPPKDE